jgi:hypothetical protein
MANLQNNLKLNALQQINSLLDVSKLIGQAANKSRQAGWKNVSLTYAEAEAITVTLTDTAVNMDEVVNAYDYSLTMTEKRAKMSEGVVTTTFKLSQTIKQFLNNEVGDEQLALACKNFVKI